MITNFALSLSFDGIELLHRVPRGWRRVGQADVASTTLDDDLKELREKAEAIEPDGLRTKLVIPLDQIKYIAIDGTRTNEDDINAVLEGATPYALNELVVDCERFGGRTHIAAVARDTLKEAEAFAAGHGFQPVAFVAVPEPFTFQKEVFFGPTDMAREIVGPDARIERDDLPVMVVGTRIKSRLLVFDLPQDVEEEVYKDDLAILLASHEARSKAETGALPTPEENEPVSAGSDTSAAPEPEIADETLAAEEPEQSQPLWVDKIPSEYHAPTKVAEVVVAVPDTAKTPLIPAQPIFASLALLDPVIGEHHPRPKEAVKAPLAAISTAENNAPKLAPVAPTTQRSATPKSSQNRSKPALIAAGIAAGVITIGGLIWSQQNAQEIAQEPMEAPVVEVAPIAPIVVAEAPVVEAPVEAAPVEEAPLETGPVIPEFRITDLGAIEASDTEVPTFTAESDLIRLDRPETITALAADAAMSPIQAPPAPPVPETAQASVGAPVIRGQVLSPAEASRIYQATGVWQRAPRFFDVPSGVIPLGFRAPQGTTSPDRIAQPQEPPLTGLDTDLSFISPANPPAPEIIFPRDDDGFILATPEGTVTPEGAVVIAGLPALNFNLRPELSQSDLDRMALLAPAPEGVVIIAGRPDIVPPLRPANARLPEVAAEVPSEEALAEEVEIPEEATPGSVGLAGLELQNSGAVALDPNVVESAALLDLRPRLRPQGLAVGVDPGTPDITDILAGIATDDATLRFDNSTRLAVVLSTRPNARPSNFDNVVSAAAARRITQPSSAPVTAAAPVPPQNFAPVPGGVARAATQEEAINLRDINLIGVYGRPNARRALVRLSNGRYVRVEVGSALDGGQVTAIGDDALNYVKRGRTFAIQLPSG
mgnify:CR=1 FL=1